MKRIPLYEYDRRNREKIVEAVEAENGLMLSAFRFGEQNGRIQLPSGTKYMYIDVSSLFSNEDRVASLLPYLERIIAFVQNIDRCEAYVILERQYMASAKGMLYFALGDVYSLEEKLGLEGCQAKNIADLTEKEFDDLCSTVRSRLFGNPEFKEKLFEELRRFRVFSAMGNQRIFSAFLYGTSGIGKTETARLIHRCLSPSEQLIKLNFGNYSSVNSLGSLIGSPRGYVGSSKGELSEKLLNSRGTVILIDEFEKASKPIHNFFLQLLEDGWFTDSLGRDYDLNKYVIIFTSNLTEDRLETELAPEFKSRLNLISHFEPLSKQEKEAYVRFKAREILSGVPEDKRASITPEIINGIVDIDVTGVEDLRKINAELMNRISSSLYPIFYSDEE